VEGWDLLLNQALRNYCEAGNRKEVKPRALS
jgi:hypothetical protein